MMLINQEKQCEWTSRCVLCFILYRQMPACTNSASLVSLRRLSIFNFWMAVAGHLESQCQDRYSRINAKQVKRLPGDGKDLLSLLCSKRVCDKNRKRSDENQQAERQHL
jgi:hypothetical protein